MDNFCAAQMSRLDDMVEGPARDKEQQRLEKVHADIQRRRKKFEAAETRRAEWNARLRRLDEDGNPLVGSRRNGCCGGAGVDGGNRKRNAVGRCPACLWNS